MSEKYKLVEKGVDYLSCFNCLKPLFLSNEVKCEIQKYGKIYYRCQHCEFHSKIALIHNKIYIRSA